MGTALEARAHRPREPRRRASRAGGRGRVHARTRSQGRPGWIARRAFVALGPGGAQRALRARRCEPARRVADAPALPDPWPREARDLFVELLLTGAPAISVIEALDNRGLWARILPEWEPVRSRPQRNAYHRFTVDRHLLETVANAAAISTRVERPDLLVLAALLHDLGKRDTGDHVEVGVGLARELGPRLCFPPPDVGLLAEPAE